MFISVISPIHHFFTLYNPNPQIKNNEIISQSITVITRRLKESQKVLCIALKKAVTSQFGSRPISGGATALVGDTTCEAIRVGDGKCYNKFC